MKKNALIITIILFASTLTTNAADLGVFGSYWNAGDGDSSIGFGGSMHFDSLPLEFGVSMFPDLTIPGVGDAMVIPIDFGLAFNLSRAESFDIYVGAGASYHIIDIDNSDPDNQFGYYTMARLEVPVRGRMNLFGEAMYRGVEFEDIDADLSGACFVVGIIFR